MRCNTVPTADKLRRMAGIGLAAIVGLAVGCGGDPAPATNVDIDMYGWVATGEGGEYVDTLTEYPGADVLKVKLTQPRKQKILSTSQHDIGSGKANISGLTIGEGLRIDFDLVGTQNGRGRRLASGATPIFDLSPGATDLSFHTMLMPPENFAPVSARYKAPESERGWVYEPTSFDGRVSNGKYTGRVGHRTVQTSKGNVLVIGGGHHTTGSPWSVPSLSDVLGDVQLFEPTNGYTTDISLDPSTVGTSGGPKRRPGGADRLSVPRAYHTVTPIGDDEFVVIGGYTIEDGEPVPTPSIEIIDMRAEPGNRVRPLVNFDEQNVELNVARAFHTATYRPEDEQIVVIGGVGSDGVQNVLRSIEVISLRDEIKATNAGMLDAPRAHHEAVLLGEENSPIWVLGGRGMLPPEGLGARLSTELVRATESGVAVDPSESMDTARYDFAAARVGPTQVVVCGGFTSVEEDQGAPTAECQVGNHQRGQWSQSWSMDRPRGGLSMTALTQSRDLTVLGGRDDSGSTVAKPTRIVYRSGQSPPYEAEAKQMSMHHTRYAASVTHLKSGLILLAGGIGQVEGSTAPLQDLEYYNPLDVVRARGIESTNDSGSDNGTNSDNENQGESNG